MSEVKRYKLHIFDRYPADGSGERETHVEMRESERGDFAKFEDIEVICSENKLLRHDVASYLETLAKVCEMLGIDLESAKSAEGKPSDVLFSYISSMQQRLTAADERADALTSALEGMLEYFPKGHSDGECFSVEKARAVLSSQASVKPGKSPYGLLEGIADLKDMRP